MYVCIYISIYIYIYIYQVDPKLTLPAQTSDVLPSFRLEFIPKTVRTSHQYACARTSASTWPPFPLRYLAT